METTTKNKVLVNISDIKSLSTELEQMVKDGDIDEVGTREYLQNIRDTAMGALYILDNQEE